MLQRIILVNPGSDTEVQDIASRSMAAVFEIAGLKSHMLTNMDDIEANIANTTSDGVQEVPFFIVVGDSSNMERLQELAPDDVNVVHWDL